ncbi:MAG: aconitate hydratase AcnA [Alphaproteobacteria bacterium]|nr:MAG: aconitate hydratase AcnA [Alphaproteobacteria bacterium]
MAHHSHDSMGCKSTLKVGAKEYVYYSLPKAAQKLGFDIDKMPFSLKVLFENLLRCEDGDTVTKADIEAFAEWMKKRQLTHEIAYRPARVLMQDFTGVPAVVDLAAMREAVKSKDGNPKVINPLSPVDLVIDHSVMVDKYGTDSSYKENVALEMSRNNERYEFLRWGQKAFNNFRVVPPGTGICHQVNLEYLAQVVWTKEHDGVTVAYPDTLVGTDSHTTMINGLGVLGWGVGGIEAEAAMLGQPVSMLIPDVIGFKLTGSLNEGVTATDLVLTVVEMLRKKGVVGKFVEFYGTGVATLSLADRATIANMAPEYGATCGMFAVDSETIAYLNLTARDEDRIALVEQYAKAQNMWGVEGEPVFTDTLELNISEVRPCVAGPKRPQDKIFLSDAVQSFDKGYAELSNNNGLPKDARVSVSNKEFTVGNGDVVIAAITSCTNTSNPSVMMAAGLVAQKALARGIDVKPWVKTSLAPGSKVVTEYLERSGLDKALDALGFNLVGYGCTTCIGNSGPLMPEIEEAIDKNKLVACSVLSGNRNFEGRVHALVRANYLASPPLVVAYAIAGTLHIDLTKDAIATDKDGKPVYLKDIWPTNEEIREVVERCVTREMFKQKYADVFTGDELWQAIKTETSDTYNWNNKSTYVQHPPFFADAEVDSSDVVGARVLAVLGDSVTTDHISPAGNISSISPAAEYLKSNGVTREDFNSYGSRRGNHEVMMRGTFANVRIRNELVAGKEGGYTKHVPSGEVMSIYDASMRYQADGVPLVVVAGKEYGTGSSRDWAAKGTCLLGVKGVIAESFERIHRSNLVGMGVLPLMFTGGMTRHDLKLTGEETLTIKGIATLSPACTVQCDILYADGSKKTIDLLCRIDTNNELAYYRSGGILQYVMLGLTNAA